ncbi:MAG: aminomethyl-transferring glycine dehydrogenase subunit GcvPA [Deltaproteobacteria bacterium]|jgi:glycine dehydrogenase subunit 1|nr:aminomethyl-transferring glycine dehydrogenase subunit GcvPA [Deltaproteobacteria bacterium]
MPFIPHTQAEVREMLDVIGVNSLDDLFVDIEPSMRPASFSLPAGLSEMDVVAKLEALAARNRADVVSFLGAGFYAHHIPAAVDAIVGRGEFATAYTPYQAECSQGTLQAIFEYQTAMCRLFDMDCANASVYDGGSAMFEGIMMAVRVTGRHVIVMDESVNPIWRTMIASCIANLNLRLQTVPHQEGRCDLQALRAAVDADCAAVVAQNPNFFGAITDLTDLFAHAKAQGALSLLAVNPVMQSVLKTPGAMGADIAVADGQPLGLPLSFGGPYLGIMTCSRAILRQFPGRIAGRTTDADGRTGYVLTLQTREQHIRRAKATSNICSNQALCALRALVHLCLLGPEGLTRVAELSMDRARYAALRLTALPGVSLLHDAPFGYEFALRLPMSAHKAAAKLSARGYVPGFPVARYYPDLDDVLLVACTECRTEEQIDALTEMLGGIL